MDQKIYVQEKQKHFYLPILFKIGDRDNQIFNMPLGQCRKKIKQHKNVFFQISIKTFLFLRTMQKYVVIKN